MLDASSSPSATPFVRIVLRTPIGAEGRGFSGTAFQSPWQSTSSEPASLMKLASAASMGFSYGAEVGYHAARQAMTEEHGLALPTERIRLERQGYSSQSARACADSRQCCTSIRRPRLQGTAALNLKSLHRMRPTSAPMTRDSVNCRPYVDQNGHCVSLRDWV
jgi:hypothetical protein